MESNEVKQALLPPAQPDYVLRGHASQVQAVAFVRANTRLVTGDADGWCIVWNVAVKRPVAVWRAHGNAILGIAPWGHRKLISHGRDSQLLVWQLDEADEASMDATLPVETVNLAHHRKSPWLLHSLIVNTLNFCCFALCNDGAGIESNKDSDGILIALPHTVNSEGVDIHQLPSERRISTIPANTSIKTGLVMALGVFWIGDALTVTAGYESGHAMAYRRESQSEAWTRFYVSKPHSQPVLSLSVEPSLKYFLTSSADAFIAKHSLLAVWNNDGDSQQPKAIKTKHSGQQSLQIRSDGKLFATAGWDSRIRVYSTKSMKELCVLKWHKEGCYATAFAVMNPQHLLQAGTSLQNSKTGEQGASIVRKGASTETVATTRNTKSQTTHWIAAGSKDGKVSLWDIY